MAQTAAAVQTALGITPQDPKIVHSDGEVVGGNQNWFVMGNMYAVGRDRLVTTTASDSAATQAAAIKTALRA